jgi:hypothetical protein
LGILTDLNKKREEEKLRDHKKWKKEKDKRKKEKKKTGITQ